MPYPEFDDLETWMSNHQYREAIEWIDAHGDEYPKRYYHLLLAKLTCLEGLEAYAEMAPILNEELSLPYVPQPYYDQMKEMDRVVQSHLQPATLTAAQQLRLLSNDQFGDQLGELLQTVQLEHVLDELTQRSLVALHSAIQHVLIDHEVPAPLKALVIDALARAGDTQDYHYTTNHLNLTINPSSLTPLTELSIFQEVLNPLFDAISQPSVHYFFETLLSGVILHYYPMVPEVDEYHALQVALIEVLQPQLNLSVDPTFLLLTSEAERTLTNEYIDVIRNLHDKTA